jgi:small GTP-binding protein
MNVPIKVVVLGDHAVGKTSLLSRWHQGTFDLRQQSTIGAAFILTDFVYNSESYKLQIWDTAGEERFQALAPIYSQNAKGAILVFDLTRRESLEDLPRWRSCLLEDIPIVIVGNKCDLEHARKVMYFDGSSAAKQMGADYFEASAALGLGVEEAFRQVAEAAIKFVEKQFYVATVVPLTRPQPATKATECC